MSSRTKALEGGASIQNLIKMPVREQIGRFKYTKAEDRGERVSGGPR